VVLFQDQRKIQIQAEKTRSVETLLREINFGLFRIPKICQFHPV